MFETNFLNQPLSEPPKTWGEIQEYVLICSCSYNNSYLLKFGRVIHLCFSQIEPRLLETLFALFEGNHYSMNL